MPFETPESKNEDSDIEGKQKTFARDYFSYLRNDDVKGLRKLAKALEEEGRKEEAAEVFAKARQVTDVLEKARQMRSSDN